MLTNLCAAVNPRTDYVRAACSRLAGLPVFLGFPVAFWIQEEDAQNRQAGMSDVERLDEPQRDVRDGSVLTSVSNAMVALHKEQFGRGPVRARTAFAGDDTLICTLQDALLPAEHALVKMGHQDRVHESRLFFQMATRDKFVAVVEQLTGRRVMAFTSATDADAAIVWEIFRFHPNDAHTMQTQGPDGAA